MALELPAVPTGRALAAPALTSRWCLDPVPPLCPQPWPRPPVLSLPLSVLGLTPPCWSSSRWSPRPPLQRSRTSSPRLVSPGPTTAAGGQSSGQGPLGGTMSCEFLPQGPVAMPCVAPASGLDCSSAPRGHQEECPCWAFGRTKSCSGRALLACVLNNTAQRPCLGVGGP